MSYSIIIPNFNGAQLLQQNLPNVLTTGADEVIIVEDASSDDSLKVLEQFKGKITLIVHMKNKGYAESINDGIRQAKSDVVVLLNSDVSPHNDFLQPFDHYFTRNEVFAVTSHEPGQGWEWGGFVNGYYDHHASQEFNKPHKSIYASGGSAAFSKQKFIELGYYDSLYYPFYWEDTDMSYRAWKRGWEIWWEPNSIIEHQRSATIKKYFSKSYISQIAQRNELLFLWKNITDSDLFAEHKKHLMLRITTHPGYVRPFLAALPYLIEVRKKRLTEKATARLTDKEVFSFFKDDSA